MRWSGHYCYCFGTKRPWVSNPATPTSGTASVGVPSRRQVSFTWLVPGRFGTAGTSSAPPSQPRVGEPFHRSAAVRTRPTAPVPHKIQRDTRDDLAELPVPDHRIGPLSQMGGSRRSPGAGTTTDE
jgi:hypothetical protein